MSTKLQERLADTIINDIKSKRPKTAGMLLETAGYGQGTALGSPGRTLAQKGVKEALRVKGFSEEQADKVVSEIMNSKKVRPDARLNAADKVYKRLGSYAPDKHETLNRNITLEYRGKVNETILKFLDGDKHKENSPD